MKRGKQPSPSIKQREAEQAVERLFMHPPVNATDLQLRLLRTDPEYVRRQLLLRMRFVRMQLPEVDLYCDLFWALGIEEADQGLLDLLMDPTVDLRARSCAMQVVLAQDPDFMNKLHEIVPPDDLLHLIAHPLADMVLRVESEPREGQHLLRLVNSIPEDTTLPLFETLDESRKRAGVSASVAYAPLFLGKVNPSVLPLVVGGLQDQGDEDAIDLLETIRKTQSPPEVLRQAQGALLRLRTRLIDGPFVPQGKAKAFVSECDTLGCYTLVVQRDNPDASATVGVLDLHVFGEIRSGFFWGGQAPDRARELCKELSSQGNYHFVETAVGRLVPLVFGAANRTIELGIPIPVGALAAVRLICRFAETPLTLPKPKGALTLAKLRALFARPEFDEGWRFTHSEIEQTGDALLHHLQQNKSSKQMWANPFLQNPAPANRFVAMFLHMAYYYALGLDVERSIVCQNVALELQQRWSRSKTVGLLAENTLRFYAETAKRLASPEARTLRPSTEQRLALRHHLKVRFFRRVLRPNASDLATLDLADEAFFSMVATLEAMNPDTWPSTDMQMVAAHRMAIQFRSHVMESSPAEVSLVIAKIVRYLTKTWVLPKTVSQQVANAAVGAMAGFVRHVCIRCPVGCWSRLHRDVSREFFTFDHPASAPR